MFFKRIEIVGFKSFATKTVCEFIPGTTIIVGPNGCGKSNILDAIKWVLGEQSASQMRGKKMMDVIFAGSSSFKALGVAQVTLTIDNSRGLLPMDYEEIQITRRLFRSGDSEYQLNKTPCRLRDIHELLMGTGVGKSAYSILEQGRVDQIMNAKPIERRYLIEEAAGISKYKARKVQTLRKLERTDTDLSRLQDLISEVERQVNSLKRQASKAERYKDLYDNCRRQEQALMVYRSRDLRERTAEVTGKLALANDRLAALRAELATQSAAEEDARDTEGYLADQLRDENQALFDIKANMSTCENQIIRLNDQVAAHQRRLDQIAGEFTELDVRAQELELRLEELSQRYKQGEESRQTHATQYEELRQAYSELEGNVRERTQRIEQLAGEIAELRKVVTRADNEVHMAEALIERQEEARGEAQTLLGGLEEALQGTVARHEELAFRSELLAEEMGTLQTDLEAGRKAQTERQGQLGQLVQDLERTRQNLHESASRLDTLNELKANYEGFYQGVREVMLAADRREVNGVLGVAANLIHADKEHEMAVEVALATHLQDIVTRTAQEAKGAIDYLKHWGRGRATFLPLDRLETPQLNHRLREILHRPGVLGIAADLVHYDREIETAVRFLLGTTLVVRDLDVGLELGRQGYRGRYVSLDGQLINPAGSMTGGRVKATGLMMREREIRDLTDKVENLNKRQAEIHGQIETIQTELTQAHTVLDAMQVSLDAKRLEANSLSKDLEAATTGKAEAEVKLTERRDQLQNMEREVSEKRESIDQWRRQLEEATTQLTERESQLEVERESAQTQGADFITMGTSVAEARAGIEKARERMVDAEHQRGTVEKDRESIERQRQARQNEIEEIKAADVHLNEQIERIQGEMASNGGEYDAMAKRLNENQALREELSTKIKVLAVQVETLTRDERQLDNQVHEWDIRQTELQTNLNNLQEKCVEKFEEELDELVERTGEIDCDPGALQVEVAELRGKLDRIGSVNMAALDEYKQQKERLDFLEAQRKDLSDAKTQLMETIQKLDETTRSMFENTFNKVRENFIEMFRRLFNGGKADLILDAPEGVDPMLDGGIEIVAQPPGKKLQNITLLSGGEKALTAISMLFGLFLYKPSPFCILDEIDAPLDDININRFKNVVAEFKRDTQFIVITHNKLTMELADAIYGVTMEESGVSKLVSVRFDQAEELIDAG